MEGPLSAFKDWFHSLPPDVRADMVVLALVPLPGIDVPRDLLLDGDIVTPALAALEQIADQDPYQQVAAVLAIRASMDFFVMRTRGTPQAWDTIQQVNENVREQMRKDGVDSDFLDGFFRELPLRRQQWLRVAKQWKDLTSDAWGNDTLSQWLDAQVPG